MATYDRRERVERHIEYVIPAPAAAAEVAKAWGAAEMECRQKRGIPDVQALSDDALMFLPWDDEIVIRFTVEEKP